MTRRNGSIHVATTERKYKDKVYYTHLLRRSFRQDGKVLHETLGNLSHLPLDLIDFIRRFLKGEVSLPTKDFEILRSLPHGHVLAVLGTLRHLKLDQMISSTPSKERDLVVAMVVSRIIGPSSKLTTLRSLDPECAHSSLALELGVQPANERDLYRAMDWLFKRQTRIENKLAKKHLRDGSLVLYDVSSSYFTGTKCPLAQFGYSRDKRSEFPQIVYGLLCNDEGCPVAIEVFEGNCSDPKTLQPQIDKLRNRFQLKRVILVGDRGMITSKRIDEGLRDVDGLDWVSALRSESIRKMVNEEIIQPSLFDQRDWAEVTSPDFPGERLIVCFNPFLHDERRLKRNLLLDATEKKLEAVVAATQRKVRPLRGKDRIGVRVGKLLNQHKVGKHFKLEITETGFSFHRNQERIDAETRLDGFYVIRTSLDGSRASGEKVVAMYKNLAKVERAFRCMKTMDLHIRPIFHRLEDRVRAHAFLCMLAYHVEWDLRRKLAPLLFEDDHRTEAEEQRRSIVQKAPRSQQAKKKDHTKKTEDRLPVQSFQSLLNDLKTLTKNTVQLPGGQEFYALATPTPTQRRAFELLELSL